MPGAASGPPPYPCHGTSTGARAEASHTGTPGDAENSMARVGERERLTVTRSRQRPRRRQPPASGRPPLQASRRRAAAHPPVSLENGAPTCRRRQRGPDAEDLSRRPRASAAAARPCLVHQLRLTSTSTVGSCVRRPTGEVGSVVVGRDGGSCPRPGVVRGQLAGRRTSTEPRLKPSAGQPPRRMQVGPPATICVLQCESLGRLNALCWTRRGRLPGA
jgi:hypothetical protein